MTVGVAKKLIASGTFGQYSAVLCITGHGLKTLDAVVGPSATSRDQAERGEALLDAENRTNCSAGDYVSQ